MGSVYGMKPWSRMGSLFSVALSLSVLANEADVTIACRSIAVYPADATDVIGTIYTLAYTSDFDFEGNINSINHEWFPFNGGASYLSYASLLEMTDDFWGIAVTGLIEAEIPLAEDSNLNSITDFFEVDRPVSALTGGTIDFGGGPEAVTVAWLRYAGETQGSLRITLASPSPVQDELIFDHVFEIFQYQGKLTYEPATEVGGSITATVDLTRAGGEGKFVGPMPLVLTDARTLERRPTQWTGPSEETYEVLGTFEIEGVSLFLERLDDHPWYAGSFFFLDGVPSTPDFQDEYDRWDLFIDDPNDANGNGIPDLTDVAGVVPSDPPTLVIEAADDSLQFTIGGQPGTTVNIEQRATLSSGDWSVLQSVTLAASSEVVVVSAPATDAFYRATIP